MVSGPRESRGDSGGCCRCSGGLCKRFKKVFCKAETYDTSQNSALESPNIETSALEYGLKYEHALEEPLSIGSLIIVTATPTEDIPRFAINVGAGDSWSEKSSLALHLNPRLSQHYVVRNSRSRGSWGDEETTSFRSFPFKPGREFTVQLLVAEKEWLIAVDGEHYCAFAHRLPFDNVTWVQVTDIAKPHVVVIQAEFYPILCPEPQEVPHRRKVSAAGDSEPEWKSHTSAKLSRGIQEGEQLVVCGRIRAMPHSFQVDLADTWHEWPHPRVLLHVNPRLHCEPTRPHQLVVFNSWADGAWGSEIRQATGSIVGGSNMQLRLARGTSEWSVWADDVLLGDFPHRGDPDTVRAVRLRGDLAPTAIYVAPVE